MKRSQSVNKITPLEETITKAITVALKRTGGDVDAAAVGLGVGRSTVYRRIRSARIDLDKIRRNKNK